jgi:intein/homing endonuclease
MASESIDSTLPKMVEAVKEILKEHKGQKGIIHCIDSEAMIKMSDGSQKRLIDVAEGEKVITWNEKELKFESSTVAANWDMGIKECINIHMENGKVLSCTRDHRILTSNRGWVQAQDLTVDDDIVAFDG